MPVKLANDRPVLLVCKVVRREIDLLDPSDILLLGVLVISQPFVNGPLLQFLGHDEFRRRG